MTKDLAFLFSDFGVLEGEEKEVRSEKSLEEIMLKTSSLTIGIKLIKVQIKEAGRNTYRINQKKSILKYIIIKLTKSKDKKYLKGIQRKIVPYL